MLRCVSSTPFGAAGLRSLRTLSRPSFQRQKVTPIKVTSSSSSPRYVGVDGKSKESSDDAMKREKVDANPSKNKSQRDKLPNSKMAAGSKASDDLDIDRLAKYSTVTKKIFTQQTKELMQQVGNSSSISSGKNGSMIEKKQKGMMKYKKGNNNIVDSKATKLHQNVERMMQYSSTNDFLQPNKEFKFESNQMLNSITEAVKNLRTINDYYKFIVDCLEFNKDKLTYGQSSLNAHDDAALLLLHSLKKPILLQGTKEDNQTDISVEQHKYQRVKQDEGVTILTRLRRRVTNKMPVAYLVGCSYLQGQLFQVAPNTIIPRSYLAEILRELGANHSDPENIAVINMMKVHRVLDLCCGGGSLAILAAKFLPKIDHVDAVDIDDDALATAKENILKHNMGTKIHSYKSDLYEGLGPARKYDLIISNPPYVEKQVVPLVPKEFQAEPIRAFDGGKHGMEIIKRILVDAEKHLHDSGYLLMEIGLTRKHFPRYFSKEFLHRILWIDTVRSRGEVFLVKKEDLRVLALKR